MARRTRSTALSLLLAAALVCVAAQCFFAVSSPTFIQPRAPKGSEASAALGALTVLTSGLPAYAGAKGPLAGTEVCLPTSKPILYLIYPLCEPIYLLSPIYLFPILLVIFGGGIAILNLLLPATQPDEDLR
mmetsp:Transcript_102725/g.209254  ORF Transcript_102725/g.209254 Transcript_102725/m.209254 type:complete len:131 (-) Transcript_102725:189-581(-)